MKGNDCPKRLGSTERHSTSPLHSLLCRSPRPRNFWRTSGTTAVRCSSTSGAWASRSSVPPPRNRGLWLVTRCSWSRMCWCLLGCRSIGGPRSSTCHWWADAGSEPSLRGMDARSWCEVDPGQVPGPGDAVVLLAERLSRRVGGGTGEPALAPHRPGCSTVDRKVNQLDVGVTLHPGDRAAGRAPTPGAHGLNVDPCFPVRTVLNTEESDEKSDQPGKCGLRVCLHALAACTDR